MPSSYRAEATAPDITTCPLYAIPLIWLQRHIERVTQHHLHVITVLSRGTSESGARTR
jgi:hypothetical protein